MKKRLLFLFAAIALSTVAIWFAACQKDPADTNQSISTRSADDRTNADSKVFPPTAHPYGKSYTEWTEVWLQQFMSYDCDNIPWVHPANVLFYTSGPVYILAGIAEVGGSASITVPHGKALLFPLVNVWWDYPCPEEYGFEPPAGVSLETWLTGLAANDLANVNTSSLSVTIDGAAVSNLSSYKFSTPLFDFTGNAALAGCFDPCITGSPQPVATAGYYVMLKPLSKGVHAVHYHMEIPAWNAVQDATYNITVE